MEIFPKSLAVVRDRLRRVEPTLAPTKSVFDEAREYIAEWEKADPHATHIAMVLDGEKEIVVSVAGNAMKPSESAGLFFRGATMVAA